MVDEGKPRAQRREEARGLAKLLMRESHETKPFRWDITLATKSTSPDELAHGLRRKPKLADCLAHA